MTDPAPAARRPAEGGERAEIGIDRRHCGEAQEPGLERLGCGAERGRRERPGMIMRIDERRHGEESARRPAAAEGDNRGDAAAIDRDVDGRPGRRAVGRQEHDAGQADRS